MKLHTKQKGAIGQWLVAAALMKLGHSVFTELGDLSKVDLIALVKNKPVRIQVKSVTSKAEKVIVPCVKAGPGYRFRYVVEEVDVFAIYVPDRDLIFFVSSRELLRSRSHCTFRLSTTRNPMTKRTPNVGDYLDFERVLRDYEQDTPTGNAVGDDIVQTETTCVGAGNCIR